MNTTKERWYTGITRYQWLVLGIALIGSVFLFKNISVRAWK